MLVLSGADAWLALYDRLAATAADLSRRGGFAATIVVGAHRPAAAVGRAVLMAAAGAQGAGCRADYEHRAANAELVIGAHGYMSSEKLLETIIAGIRSLSKPSQSGVINDEGQSDPDSTVTTREL
jgi:hypothetical protein